MNKKPKIKKLKMKKDTLKVLSSSQLGAVGGGCDTTSVTSEDILTQRTTAGC